MQYQVISTAEIDGPLNQQPGWCVAEITEDDGEGRVVAGPFPSHGTAQAKADLLLISRQNHVEDYVDQFIRGPEQFGRRDMLKTMRRGGLTETEMHCVLEEVDAARESVATFAEGRAAGRLDADMGGCAA